MSTSWKQWLTEAEENSRGVGKSAYKTAMAVRQLWKSREFLAEACDGVLDDMSSKLSKFSGRFALALNDMLQMIDQFPNEKDWSTGRLDLLRDETCKLLLSKSPRNARQEHKRHVISQAQYKALERKYRSLRTKYAKLKAEHESLLRKQRSKVA